MSDATAGPADAARPADPGPATPDPQAALDRLGITLPAVPAPLASYVPAVAAGTTVWTAGQLPVVDGQLTATGTVGDGPGEVDVATAADAARTAALNAVAAAAAVAGGIGQLARVVKLTVFVACGPGFTAHPAVADGASTVVGELFGEAGRHARSAVGVASLPKGSPVEVELVAVTTAPLPV